MDTILGSCKLKEEKMLLATHLNFSKIKGYCYSQVQTWEANLHFSGKLVYLLFWPKLDALCHAKNINRLCLIKFFVE
jgi:hypothetical protein